MKETSDVRFRFPLPLFRKSGSVGHVRPNHGGKAGWVQLTAPFLKTIPVYAVFIQTPGKVKSILGISTIIYKFLEPFNISPKTYFASYAYNAWFDDYLHMCLELSCNSLPYTCNHIHRVYFHSLTLSRRCKCSPNIHQYLKYNKNMQIEFIVLLESNYRMKRLRRKGYFLISRFI